MRPIDADALLKYKNDHQMISTHLIFNAPTLDVKPVVRGKWIPANGTYYCSNCKHYAWDAHRFPFCQDCGADMREVKE